METETICCLICPTWLQMTEPKVVFTPRERKINKFSGKQEDNQTVDEFIEDIELGCQYDCPLDDNVKGQFDQFDSQFWKFLTTHPVSLMIRIVN